MLDIVIAVVQLGQSFLAVKSCKACLIYYWMASVIFKHIRL